MGMTSWLTVEVDHLPSDKGDEGEAALQPSSQRAMCDSPSLISAKVQLRSPALASIPPTICLIST